MVRACVAISFAPLPDTLLRIARISKLYIATATVKAIAGRMLSLDDTPAERLPEIAEFQPDRRRKYSNTNYVLIGEIFDRTLGYSHHQYVKD